MMVNQGNSANTYISTTTGIAGDGAVTTFYDQAGSNNATNSSDSEQPLIVEAGDVVLENNKPAIQFDGVDDYLQNTSLVSSTPTTHYLTAKANRTGVLQRFFDGGVSSSARHSIYQNGTFQYFGGGNISGDSEDTNQNLHYFLANGTSSEIAINGATASTGSGGTNTLNGLTFAARYDGAAQWGDVLIQELIIFDSDKSGNRLSIEGNIGRYYNLTGYRDGFVTKWYDQSGEYNHAENSTSDEQPQIVSNGSMLEENGKAAIDFDGVDDYFTGGAKTTMDNTAIFAVIKSDSNTQDSVFIQNTLDASNFVALGLGGLGTSNAIGSRLRVGGSTVDSVGDSTFTATDQTLVSYLADNTAGQMFIDGTEETDTVDSRSGGSSTTIGARGDGNNQFNGAMQEVIFFDSDKSGNREDIEKNINTHFKIYS
jgi:hypothetical protein